MTGAVAALLAGASPAKAGAAVLRGPAVAPARGGLYAPNAAPLQPTAFLKLPPGAVTPRGWLAGQLRRQLDGLCGHYAETSHFLDFDTTGWVHPQYDGWEEVPYWLRGYIDLAAVTGDATALATARRWVDAILATRQPDGFFGPSGLRTQLKGGPDFWPHLPMMQALRTWEEYTGDARIVPFLTSFLRYMNAQGQDAFDSDWVSVRWGDGLDSVFWLYNRTGDGFLLDLADKIHRWGADWVATLPSLHNVNVAQGFREPAQYALRSGDASLVRATYQDYDTVMGAYGQFAGGGFAGDENARPGYGDPRQGFETCGIVEFMASHQLLTRLTGDPVWADRCEDLAFNSLPAALDPAGRAVHYITSANSVDLDDVPKTEGQFQNGFAMQAYLPAVDQYRCCPHNYGMGWPYFTEGLWLATPDQGLAAAMYAASSVTAKVADGTSVTIAEDTTYPFSEQITFTVGAPKPLAFPLYLRIPAWCAAPRLTVAGAPVTAPAGPAFVKLDRTWNDGDVVTLTLPQQTAVRTWSANHDSLSVDHGPLTYSLEIGERYELLGGTGQFPEYAVHATTPWNYGLAVDPATAASAMTFAATGGPLPDNPFTPGAVPVRITAPARRIAEWTADDQDVVTPLQASPARSTAPVEPVTLIPMGAARLRVTSFPTASPEGHPWSSGGAGAGWRIVNRNSGKVLGVDRMSTADSAPVVQFADNGTADHVWHLVANGDGWYRVRNHNSGKVLGVDRMSTADSAPVVQFADTGTADHLWQLIDNGDGWWRLKNRNSGKVLGVDRMSTADSAPVVQFADTGTADHLWQLIPDGQVRIENRNSAKILGVDRMSTADGAHVVQFGDTGTADHRWTFQPTAAGWLLIRNVNSGRVLGVEQMSTADSAQIVQSGDDAAPGREWRLLDDGSGWFRIVNRTSGKVLGVDRMSTADSAPVVQFTDNGTADHLWRLR
ncbi:glycoside hydrolase family 127 protein [Amycolatopsis sp. PS_44_ISF1]|nr:RICIN domain-containing protein [Amycolatopsis sp. PS_44_ISF1]MDT8914715.1 glycoside hydrolase family 127 protein [Amycolatopsis sp. PS_44_ISF1]